MIRTIKYSQLQASKELVISEMMKMGFIRLQFDKEFDFSKIHLATHNFFDLKEEQKKKMEKNKTDKSYFGYFPSSLNGKQGLDIPNPQINNNHVLTHDIKFPQEYAQQNIKNLREYFEFVHRTGMQVLNILYEGVEKLFQPKKNLSVLRLNYYPKHEENDNAVEVSNGVKLACETHVDNTWLTMLYQDDCGGLQIQDPQTGKWISAEYTQNSLIVNTGKILSFMTNDKFIPVNHRVLLNYKERISVPYFMCPNVDSVLANNTRYIDFLVSTLIKFKQYEQIAIMIKNQLAQQVTV